MIDSYRDYHGYQPMLLSRAALCSMQSLGKTQVSRGPTLAWIVIHQRRGVSLESYALAAIETKLDDL